MIQLDALWGCRRNIKIRGLKEPYHVPFAVDLSSNLVEFIRVWRIKSGDQWTLRRVKALKTWALQVLSGSKDYAEPWFRTEIYHGYKIPQLKIFKLLVDSIGCNLRTIKLILIVLNSYKQRILGEPSLEAITGVQPTGDTSNYVRLLRQYVTLPSLPGFALEGTLSIPSRRKFYRDGESKTFSGPIGQPDPNPYWRTPALMAMFKRVRPVEVRALGMLVPIKDKGKFRNILVGNEILQLATKKLGDWLREWLWTLDEVASGDQTKMERFAIDNLAKGKYMLSIDLSEATDRLSRDFQVKLLESMGLPLGYLGFLNLPFVYSPYLYGKATSKDRNEVSYAFYANGQPMGLYFSFPLFELAHYVILKFSVATTEAKFCICGDDVMVATTSEADGRVVFDRYKNLVERLGGVISTPKTLMSYEAAEGVGALFLKGYPKAIRIPSGKLSTLEAYTKGTQLNQEVVKLTFIGRALLVAWLSTKLFKEYTYDMRKVANTELVTRDLSHLNVEALRSLVQPDQDPIIYSILDKDCYHFWMMSPEVEAKPPYRLIGLRRIRELMLDNKILNLLKGN